ncbi:hypothetical protein [Chryseolinea lacunae]|uniref:Uncharacterized protein n=1 Tax=Chryseolinea lacunae TaxID=2801331 RepID=A0ABS1KNR9_9BACT|nr:hypothetical protein [Chryseolinea lacunae]MBL0740989.1 hypothetical protein [Chryseolinea lacunae]
MKADTLISADSVATPALDLHVIRYDSSHYYIFPITFSATELTEREIKECEDLLKHFLADYNIEAEKRFDEISKEHPTLKFDKDHFTIRPESYGRQYMAVASNNEKFVYVNCFCDPGAFDYRHAELVEVSDGGNCFFSFKVDLKNRRIFDFMVNGEA